MFPSVAPHVLQVFGTVQVASSQLCPFALTVLVSFSPQLQVRVSSPSVVQLATGADKIAADRQIFGAIHSVIQRITAQ